MYKKKRILALITARGGSKGLPGKNIRLLNGKPLIAWSIEHGLKSRYVDKVVVSTDDKKIASTAKKYGAEVPFMRPAYLATDKSTSMDVILHAIGFLKAAGEEYDYIIILEPTSPLRETKDVDRSIEMLLNDKKGAESIVGVSEVVAAHPAFDVVINDKGFLSPYEGKRSRYIRRQDLKKIYFFEGTVYVSEIKALKKKKTFYHDRTIPYIVPKWKSVEIDDIVDFFCAEAILKNKRKITGEK